MMGALPLAMGIGSGAELRQPLGVAVVGGLIFSQAVTCEQAEDVAKARYHKALEETLPEDTRVVVQRQYDGVMTTIRFAICATALALSKPDRRLAKVRCCRARIVRAQ
jgi:hypothetical protein